jgi:hypothetical protein
MLTSKSEAQKTVELGFNSTDVIQNDIGFVGNNPQTIEPYTLSFRLGDERGAFRFGMGGGYASENNQQFSTGVLNTEASHLDLSIGYEWRVPIGQKIRFFYGAEGIYSSIQNQSDFTSILPTQSFITTTQNGEKRYTASPFFGLHYQFNQWIAISTKSRMNFTLSEKVEETADQSNGIVQGPDYTIDYYFNHILPNSIYIYFNLDKLPSIKK